MQRPEKERLFAKEYRRLFDRLYRYVRARIRSVYEAEDLVAEVLFAGFRGLDGYDPEKGNMEQWLVGIARFHLIAYWKKSCATINLDDYIETLSDENGANREEQTDLAMAWEKVMAVVPVEVQSLLIMKFAEDMTFEQIAEVIGTSPQALRQTFSRLFKKLRLQFTEADLL